MFSLSNINFEFGSRVLFDDASWQINDGEKIGLVGPNGCGKSTLLRIMVGEYKGASGTISMRKNMSIGFLNQDLLSFQSDDSILHVALQAFDKQNALLSEIEQLLKEAETNHEEKLLQRLHDAQTEFEALDGYNIKHKAEEVLEGLGFATSDLERPLKEFSGGWRMRVILAKILLRKPELLLLDEPTNHLDLPSIQWLESYLQNFEGAVVIVSHDRYFLDRTVKKIVEVDNRVLTEYAGDYAFYREEKKLRRELQQSQYVNQQQFIKQQERFIERFRAKNTKAAAVQSRIKALDRLERIDEVENEKADIRIRLDFAQQPGKIVADLDIKEKKYGDLVIMKETKAVIERGDKIALIGANGKGKSTLLRMIYGTEPFDGSRADVYNVLMSFYAQHQLESLDIKNDLLTELQHQAPDQNDTVLRSLLGAFLFHGDDVFKKIKVLSGGEKARVALAKTILTKSNFLLLDEPTNHLDISSVNVLIKVLQDFKGSFLVVSHDRYFISQIATKMWWIENQQLKEYPGTYEEYEWNTKNIKKTMSAPSKKESSITTDPSEEQKSNSIEKEKKRLKQKLEKEIQKIEEESARLELQKKELHAMLADPEIAKNKEKLFSTMEQLKINENRLTELTKNWEQKCGELEM